MEKKSAKIAILLPRENIMELLKELLEREPELGKDILDMRVVETSESLETARQMIDNGAHIIIARGVQAGILKKYTKIPVVEIVSTTQEIGLMIKNARERVNKKHPSISMVTMRNAISDTAYINELFDVDFSVYHAETIEELELMVGNAIKDGADAIIGGDKVGRIVKQYNIPHIFSVTTVDSLRIALNIANRMSYTADVEREMNAQVETILDSTFNGVIRIDSDQRITIINRMMEELLMKKSSDVVGRTVDTILELDEDYIRRVLTGKQESCLTSAKIRSLPVMAMISPLSYDGVINGAIISCHKLKNVVNPDRQTVREMYLSGYTAKGDFDWIFSKDQRMRDAVELAKKYALSKHPVLIHGYDDMENALFAQSIHNNSLRKNSPFVSVNCSQIRPENQLAVLFGSKNEEGRVDSVLGTAGYGTVYIREIDCMSLECQYQLYKLVSDQGLLLSDIDKTPRFDVRVIAATKENLEGLVKQGSFRMDLYYALNGLVIGIPPLGERKEDVEFLIKQHLRDFKENYSRYLFVTEKAMEAMKKYSWKGGAVQLESFCERLFLSASRKNISEEDVNELLDQLYPEQEAQNPVFDPAQGLPEAEQIVFLMQKYSGSRNLVASAMGISTTTLWRRMKKYGLDY